MYYQDKAAAVKYITNRAGFVEYSSPSREIRQEWRDYFMKNDNLPRVTDGQMIRIDQDLESFRSLDAAITMAE